MKRLPVLVGHLCVFLTAVTAALAQAPSTPLSRPRVWAIVIGIGRYSQPAIPSCRTAVRDAFEVLQWLRRAGWDERQQLLLRDLGAADPGEPDAPAPNILPLKQNLDWAFREWLFPRAKPGDLVVIYFAGRGRAIVKPQGPRVEPRVDYYLLPTDTIAGDIELRGWSLDRAVDSCVRRKLQVVCWLATSMQDDAAQAQPRDTPTSRGASWLAALTRWPGVSAWLASDRPAVPGTADDPGGPFTSALLGALGKPDRKRNLAASLNELREHPQLRLRGFRAMGGVPPQLSLWKDLFGQEQTRPRPEIVLQVGHAARVTALSSSADGRQLMSASADSTVRIWAAEDRSLLRVLPGHLVGATALALGRDDRWLISAGGSGSVLIYDRNADYATKRVAPRQPHYTRVVQLALLPDGVHFVSIDQDALSFLWDLTESPVAPRAWLPQIECLEVACGGKLDGNGKDTGVVLARCGDGKVRVFDSSGSGGAPLEIPGDSKAVAVSPDGRLLAAGFAQGKVVVQDRATQKQSVFTVGRRSSTVRRLSFSPTGKLAAGHEKGARLIDMAAEAGGASHNSSEDGALLVDRPLQSLLFSHDGAYLAACTENVGALSVWRVDGDATPQVVHKDPAANASLLGFTPDGRGLLIGDFYGGLAYRPLDAQGKEPGWKIPDNRGKLRQLAATPNRGFLAVRDEERHVRIWDLKDRTCRRLRGTWTSCAFLDDDRLAVVADSNAADLAGRLVLFDRRTLKSDQKFFAYAARGFNLRETLQLDRLAVSPDRSRIAAASDPNKDPLVCIWAAKDGRLTHWITPARLEYGVHALSFSTDGRYLLTAGDAPTAKLWDLSAGEGNIDAPLVTLSDPSVKSYVTCAAIRPNRGAQVATGHNDGEVHLWSWAGTKGKLDVPGLVRGEFAGAVNALCFTADGQYLAATGNSKSIWVGAMEPRPRALDLLAPLRPHHFEQINDLVAWRDQPLLISASDDTTVRFWDLGKGALRGTFSAAGMAAVADLAPVQELDWVFYTPDGRYDAPPSATKLVKYRRRDQAMLLDRFEKTHNEFRLAEQLLTGADQRLTAEPADPAPVTISAPPRPDTSLPETKLTITLGANDLKDVRLYHNDVVIPCGFNDKRARGQDLSLDVAVRLLPARNRFYVMASQEGAYDSCSNVLEVDYDGPMERGQVHVLAIGVGGYERQRLHYPGQDAERLSEVLHARGIDTAGQPGLRIVIPESELSRDVVERRFEEIARAVEDRPQDTVVVFLAGHTGVFDPQRFCLLLPSYPFPKDAPLLVAARLAPVNPETGAKIDPKHVLPYSQIALNLMKLKALNRLVIVDACQAEAILEDGQVRAIQRWMEVSTRRTRTSYLMAARRGEPALELDPLGHGLFTYTLLRGMGAISLAREPGQVAKLGLPADADFDKNGILTTSELDAYVKAALPQIAAVFPEVVAIRRAAVSPRPAGPPRAAEPLDQRVRLQSAQVSFPLIPLR
jgi:WD40 repeat protein/uncharacterized caspase-like protein